MNRFAGSRVDVLVVEHVPLDGRVSDLDAGQVGSSDPKILFSGDDVIAKIPGHDFAIITKLSLCGVNFVQRDWEMK